jgi:hypothetical protein
MAVQGTFSTCNTKSDKFLYSMKLDLTEVSHDNLTRIFIFFTFSKILYTFYVCIKCIPNPLVIVMRKSKIILKTVLQSLQLQNDRTYFMRDVIGRCKNHREVEMVRIHRFEDILTTSLIS